MRALRRRTLLADAALLIPLAAVAPLLLVRTGAAAPVRLPLNAPPAAFLADATRAIRAGRRAEAEEALERAESRILQAIALRPATEGPGRDPRIRHLAAARRALAAGDHRAALADIDAAAARVRQARVGQARS